MWLDITELRTPSTYDARKLGLVNVGTIYSTVTSISAIGSVLTSTTLAGQANQTYTSVTSTGGSGTGARFTVIRNASGAVSSVTNTVAGTGYTLSDTIIIPGINVGGASPQDNITFQFTTGSVTSTTIPGQLNQVYTNVPTTSSGTGTGARFTVTRNASGAVTTVTLTTSGSGYTLNDTITISYTNIGGTSASDNISFPVTFGPVLTSTTLASQASQTYTNVPSSGGSGSGARFTVVRNISAAVSSVTYTASTGAGYFVGDTITIAGTNVGGTGPADNITFQVTTINTTQNQNQRNQTSSLTPATSFAVIPMDVLPNFQRTFKEATDYAWSVTYPSRLDSIERLTVRWLDNSGTVVNFGNAQSFDPNMFVLRVYTQIVPTTPERPLSLPPPVREGLFEDKSRVYLGALGTLIVGLIMIMLVRKRR